MEKKKQKIKKKTDNEKNKILMKIKNFFNNPVPLIIVLIAIICVLLIFISKMNTKSKIYVGEINKDGMQVVNVHYFTNNDMNYFYSSTPLYIGEYKDKEVYSYQIGYYVEDKNGEIYEFATRSKSADTKAKLSVIIEELGGWSFAESYNNKYFFTNEVINNMDNLHLMIKASTKKGTNEADISLDFKVDLTKISK
ncbi:MAG: hypothetical protein OSJ65_00180 [Bacilli bacterium]|nr:hypothetical protein [Bacilli bacterium]